MDTKEITKAIGEKTFSNLKEIEIEKFEEAVQRDSEEIVELSKRFFWNNIIVIGFTAWALLYTFTTVHPQRAMIWTSMLAILIASGERLYIQRKIKKTVYRLSTFSMIIEFLKKIKNESTCSR
jgi:hypothetical protein